MDEEIPTHKSGQDEILTATNSFELAETGGGHNQQGVDFQRAWAISRMFELEQEGAEDFLFLFEAMQDVVEVDSEKNPTSICIYQVKKKDRGEWSWNDLTSLIKPDKKTSSSQDFSAIKDSPVGKIYTSILSHRVLKAKGKFVSNAGCDLPLEGGGNAATSCTCDLSGLESGHLELLGKGLETLHKTGGLPANPSRILVEKVPIHPDGATTYLKGIVLTFLSERSARHAGQAGALVDALLAKVGPLGAKTKACNSFDELRKERGYSKSEFIKDIAALENVPDQISHLDRMLQFLISENAVNFMDVCKIHNAATDFFKNKLIGNLEPEEEAVCKACIRWISENPPEVSISKYLDKARRDLAISSLISPERFTAHLLLGLADKCVDPT